MSRRRYRLPWYAAVWSEARRREVKVQEFPFSYFYEPAFAAMFRDGAEAVLDLAESKHLPRVSLIARLARQHRLPLMSPFRRMTEVGGLMSYGVNWNDIDRRLAAYAARILEGATPSDLPFEQPSTSFGLRHRVPTLSGWSAFAHSGGLLTYGPRLPESYRRLASYADRILKGSKPADIPIERPSVFELVINLRTARALGLEVSPSLIARADEIVE